MENSFIQTDPGDEQQYVDKGHKPQQFTPEPKVVRINRSPDIDEE